MRVLEIDRAGEALIQGFVRAEWPQRADLSGGRAGAWIRMFLRSAALWQHAKPLSAGLRIEIAPGRPVTTVHSFVCAKTDEERLRLVLAAFMRTDQMGAGQTAGPQTNDALEGRFIHPDESRVAMPREILDAGKDLEIHHNLRIADQLPRLLQTFADLGVPFAYEMHAAPWSPPREALRNFRHRTQRLLDARGVPPALRADQEALVARVMQAGWHMEECLSAPSTQHIGIVQETLGTLLSESLYATLGGAPRVEPVDDELAEAFAHHVHSHLVLEPQPDSVAGIAAAATREDVDRCLSCAPLGLGTAPTSEPQEPLVLSLGPIGPGPTGRGPASAAAPASPFAPAASNGGPYLFVSYARADSERVYPLVEQLSQQGASVWIDRRIVGGDDWISELEARLLGCDGLLAFISPSFMQSRYCCREVRFADTINKRIIPVMLQPAQFSAGMSFILHAVQTLGISEQPSSETIVSAIRSHVPSSLRPH